MRLATEEIEDLKRNLQLFKLERHSTRANKSGSAEKFNDKLYGVVIECLVEGVMGSDIHKVLSAVSNHCDMIGPSSRLPSLSWINRIRTDIPTFVEKQVEDFVRNSDHLTFGTDDTSLRQTKVASYGLHNQEGEYLTIAMKNISATNGDQIADHLMAVINDQKSSVRDMIKKKLKGVITDRGPAAESGAKKFVKKFNQLYRRGQPDIFVLPCTLHMQANGTNYMAGELSEDAKDAMARIRRIFGDRQTGNYNKHSLCEPFKSRASVSSPFKSNLGCRFDHWPTNGQNIIDFEEIVRELLDNKKSLTTEQISLKKLMKNTKDWKRIRLECGALFVLYEHLLLPLDIAVSPSKTTVKQLKKAMKDLLTRLNVAETIGLENLISIVQDLLSKDGERMEDDDNEDEANNKLSDKQEALKKLEQHLKAEKSTALKNNIDAYITRAVTRLRVKIEKDFKMIEEALATGLEDDLIVPFHNRASERSFAVMKAIQKKIPTMDDNNRYMVSIARQNHLSVFMSTLSDTSSLITEARSKRKELLENRRARHDRLARDKLAAEFDFVDLDDK